MPSFAQSFNKASLLLLASLTAGNALAAQVTVVSADQQSPTKTLTMPDNARLDALLAEPGLPSWSPVYSRISTPALDAQLQAEQQRVLTTLQRLADDRDVSVAVQTDSRLLSQQLATLKVVGRIPVVLDRDRLRIRPTENAPLVGEYHLYLANRPQQSEVTLFGLHQGASRVPLQAGNSVSDLLANQTLPAYAERRFVYLCQPDGEVSTVHVAYWNALHREPMPGAALFIGFDESDSSYDFHTLNQSIASLLAARIAE